MSDMKVAGPGPQPHDKRLLQLDSHARDKGFPIVAMSAHDVLAVLRGHALVCATLDGGEALIRLYTADEYLSAQHAAVERITPFGVKVSPARAIEMTRPLPQVLP